VIEPLARRQHGVVARRQLLEAGLGANSIDRALASGWLRLLHRGVYGSGGQPSGTLTRWMAAVLAGGAEAVLSHRSAGELWGLLEPIEGPVHVTVRHSRRAAIGILFHRSRDLGQRTERHGIPCTTVARTLLDLAGFVSRAQLSHVFDEARRRGLLRRTELVSLCRRSSGRRGLGSLRALLDERPLPVGETRSQLERRFLRFCRERGLPIPAVNAPLAGYEVDCLWPERGVVVELDSWTHHGTREAFESDRKRDASIQMAGYRILRVTHRRIGNDGDELEAEIRELLGTRSHSFAESASTSPRRQAS
jgi:very-short-patch-repair endonuclease